jgi:hypothetical protein
VAPLARNPHSPAPDLSGPELTAEPGDDQAAGENAR